MPAGLQHLELPKLAAAALAGAWLAKALGNRVCIRAAPRAPKNVTTEDSGVPSSIGWVLASKRTSFLSPPGQSWTCASLGRKFPVLLGLGLAYFARPAATRSAEPMSPQSRRPQCGHLGTTVSAPAGASGLGSLAPGRCRHSPGSLSIPRRPDRLVACSPSGPGNPARSVLDQPALLFHEDPDGLRDAMGLDSKLCQPIGLRITLAIEGGKPAAVSEASTPYISFARVSGHPHHGCRLSVVQRCAHQAVHPGQGAPIGRGPLPPVVEGIDARLAVNAVGAVLLSRPM